MTILNRFWSKEACLVGTGRSEDAHFNLDIMCLFNKIAWRRIAILRHKKALYIGSTPLQWTHDTLLLKGESRVFTIISPIFSGIKYCFNMSPKRRYFGCPRRLTA